MVGFSKWLARLLGHPVDAIDKLRSLAAKYGVEVLWDEQLSEEAIVHAKLNTGQIVKACSLLSSELAIYPLITVKRSQLKRIVFATNLQVHKAGAGGVFNSKRNTIILSLDKLISDAYARGAFHHEFFHCIDYVDDYNRYLDPHWNSLNEVGFQYSADHKTSRGFVSRLGFMTNYSMSAVWEDKAELYQNMILHNRFVYQHAISDEFLRKKLGRMTELLQYFSPGYDAQFWLRRSENSVPYSTPMPVVVTLKISWERVATNDIFFVTREGSLRQGPLAFYSLESLKKGLSQVQCSEAPALAQLFSNQREPITIRFKTDEQTLANSDFAD